LLPQDSLSYSPPSGLHTSLSSPEPSLLASSNSLVCKQEKGCSELHWVNYTDCYLSQDPQGKMCIKEVNNIYSIVLEIVKGRNSIKRNPIIKTDTLNTVCEIQTVFSTFTVLSFLWDMLHIIHSFI